MQKRNISAGILQNPMGLRQAQLSETAPYLLELHVKIQDNHLSKNYKMQHGNYIHSPCGSIQMSTECVSTSEFVRKKPLQKNLEEDIGRVPIPLSCRVETCIQQFISGSLHVIAANGPLSCQRL